MWLPTPIYERAPLFSLLLGLLFVSAGIYMGFESTMAFVYIGAGFFCISWSARVVIMRSKSRHYSPPAEVTDVTPPLDHTQPVHISERMHANRAQRDGPPADAVRG